MRRSIRHKLLILHSLIAITMATIFGGLTYFNVRHATYRTIDSQLRELAQDLATVLSVSKEGSFLVELTNSQLDAFHIDNEQSLYYLIWDVKRSKVDISHPALDIPIMASDGSRTRDGCRELMISGPSGSRILVGKKIPHELQQLSTLAATSMLVGFIALAAMLGGGWYLIGRALDPIHRISHAAEMVSESRLSERIDVTTMEVELSELAQAINHAFDRLQQTIERQTRFTADASHEMRTPLSIILAHTDRILHASREPAEYQEVLRIVQKSARRMQGLVAGLLTLAQQDSPEIELHMEPIQLGELVEEECDNYQELATSKSIRLDVYSVPACVLGNQSLLSEAIGNLVRNAIQYTPSNGLVQVRLERHASKAILTVTDNGPGIAIGDQSLVFDRFFRVDKVRTSNVEGGLGLGLAITKSIIETHHGNIGLTSELGVGTTFTLTLGILVEQLS